MKVILLQDVAKIGRRFDIVEVPTGYGMNKLVPQGMAKPATSENIKAIKAQSDTHEAARVEADETFAATVAAMKGVALEMEVEANEEGRMFQALKVEAIVDALEEKSLSVQLNQVVIKTPIKDVGEHTVELVSGDTHVQVKVQISAK